MQIDWLSGAVEASPQAYPGYDSGRHLVIGPDGQVVRESHSRHVVEDESGSWSKKFTVWTPTPGKLFISGNPIKLLQEHNAFGSCDAFGLFLTAGLFVRTHAGLFPGPQTWAGCEFSGPRFTRIDLTRSYRFPSTKYALEWLRTVAASARYRQGGSLTKGDTVYFGKNSTRWTMKLYAKETEILARLRQRFHRVPAAVVDWSAGVVRFELTLRTPELQKHPDLVTALHGSGADSAALRLWELYHGRIAWNGNADMSQTDILEESLPSHLQVKLAAWRSGADMRRIMSKPTFYRVRRELLDTLGVDIAAPPVEPESVPVSSGLDPAGWDPEPLAAHYVQPDQDIVRQYGLHL